MSCIIGHVLLNCNRLRYERSNLLSHIEEGLGKAPITLLLGPRQCGKTTLARYYEGRPDTHWFDLENYLHRSRLEDNPMGTLASLRGRVNVTNGAIPYFGPAPTPLPQLPLFIDPQGF